MQRPTLANFRGQWPSEATGICQADPVVANWCNDAQQRLMIDPTAPEEGWWGGTATLNLTVQVQLHSAYVVTPREVARLTNIAVCDQPIALRNKFYEYLRFGPGLQPKKCGTGWCNSLLSAYERDTVPTLAPLLATPQKLRFYPSDTRDTALRVLPQGLDQNGKVILTTDPSSGLSAPGEYISLAFPFSDSLNQWSRITGLLKDETYGPVQCFQVDPTTGDEVLLTSMEPNEGTANYRRYLVNGIPNKNLCCQQQGKPLQITAEARLDFIPVVNENDFLLVQNVPALIEEVLSIRYSRMDGGADKAQYRTTPARWPYCSARWTCTAARFP